MHLRNIYWNTVGVISFIFWPLFRPQYCSIREAFIVFSLKRSQFTLLTYYPPLPDPVHPWNWIGEITESFPKTGKDFKCCSELKSHLILTMWKSNLQRLDLNQASLLGWRRCPYFHFRCLFFGRKYLCKITLINKFCAKITWEITIFWR